MQVDLDIKPGSDSNPINLKSKRVIPTAILTTDGFDATGVDASTVLSWPDEAAKAHQKNVGLSRSSPLPLPGHRHRPR